MTQKSSHERRDWEDPKVVERNKEPGHVPLMPFGSEAEALRGGPSTSPYCASLNGTWKFRLSPNPASAPDDFQKPGTDVSSWEDISVPGCWQLQGYDKPFG